MSDQPTAVVRTPAASRLCSRLVVAFAVWTLLANLVVALGGNLRTLVISAAAAGAVGLVGWLALRRRGRAESLEERLDATRFRESLAEHRVGAVALRSSAAWREEMVSELTHSGYRKAEEILGFEIWVPAE